MERKAKKAIDIANGSRVLLPFAGILAVSQKIANYHKILHFDSSQLKMILPQTALLGNMVLQKNRRFYKKYADVHKRG